VVLIPDAGGGLAMAVGGLGKRQGALSLWHAAGFAERLPPGSYRLAQSFGDAEATQIALGSPTERIASNGIVPPGGARGGARSSTQRGLELRRLG